MLLSKNATVVWNSRNKRHYTDLGYHFTKMGEQFNVAVEDLTSGSQAVVDLRCDYCGRTYQMTWYCYAALKRKLLTTDCCGNCSSVKAAESVNKKYGGYSELFHQSNDKRVATNMKLYGAANPFSSKTIQDRIVSSNMKKYGVPYSQQNPEVRSKTMRTCFERYGVPNYIELYKGSFIKENSPCWKGGVENSRAERSTFEYNTWREHVFQRDGYSCMKCGRHNGDGVAVVLNAHHINNWADNPELRFAESNGITLCDKCHQSFHSMFGKRFNNAEQLQEFLSVS